MVKEHYLEEARLKFSFAWRDIPLSPMLNCPKRYYENAVKSNTEVVNYIETTISQYQSADQQKFLSIWQDLLCEASFGKGLSEGLLEMKKKTYKNRYRSFHELESIIKEVNKAYESISLDPKFPEGHLRIGKGLGCLGLAKEGKKMLENENYWSKIQEYLSTK